MAKETILTREYLDKSLGNLRTGMTKDLKEHVTREIGDLAAMSAREFARVHTEFKKVHENHEELARITAKGFEDIAKRIDVREELDKLRNRIQIVEHELHISA